MSSVRFSRRAALFALSLGVVAATPVLAVDLGTPAPSGLAMRNHHLPAEAVITITHEIGKPVEHNAVLPGAVPTNWNCTWSDVRSVYTVTCEPRTNFSPSEWSCPRPYVLGSYSEGLPAETLMARVGCGGRTVWCNPQQMGLPQAYCEEHFAGPITMPFTCSANYSGMLPTTSWSVICRTY